MEDHKASSPVTSYQARHNLQYSPHKVIDNLMATLKAKIDSSDTELGVAWSSTAERMQTLERKLESTLTQLSNWSYERQTFKSRIEDLEKEKHDLRDELSQSHLK